MNSIIEKLAAIEKTAEDIVDNAENRNLRLRDRFRQRETSLTGNLRKR